MLSAPSGPRSGHNSFGFGRDPYPSLPESRKRPYNDAQENGDRGNAHYTRGDRQTKQPRRGRGGRGDSLGSRGGRNGFQEVGFPFNNAGSPPLPSSFSNMPNVPLPQGIPFDPNDPISAILALQAMGLPPIPGVPPIPQAGSPNGHPEFGGQGSAGLRKRERCRDYDTQGYCARGDSCPYEHGTDRLIAPSHDGKEYSICFMERLNLIF